MCRHHSGVVFPLQACSWSDSGYSRALPRCFALVLRSVLALRLLVFLVVKGLDNFVTERPGSFAAMLSALLHQHGDNNFRVAARRVADKPGIIFEFFLFPKSLAGRVTDDLRGTRFSAYFNPRQPDVSRRAAVFVHNAVHRVGYFLHGRFGKREAFFSNILRIHAQVWLFENAAHGDPTDHARELERSRGDGALTGGHRNRFTGIPFAMKDTLDPFGGSHQPGHFPGETHSGLESEAELVSVVRKTVDAQAHSDVVKEDVARLEDCFVHPQFAVSG